MQNFSWRWGHAIAGTGPTSPDLAAVRRRELAARSAGEHFREFRGDRTGCRCEFVRRVWVGFDLPRGDAGACAFAPGLRVGEEGVRGEAYFTTVGMTWGSSITKQAFGGATQLIALYQNCLVW